MLQYCKGFISLSKKVAEQFLLVNEFLANLEAKLKYFSALYLIPLYSRSYMDSPVFFHIYILCQTPNSSLSQAVYGRTIHKEESPASNQ